MAEEAVGTIVLIVDGEEYDCASCEPSTQTGRRPLPTMNRQQRTKFRTSGNKSHALNVAVVIPDGKDRLDWDDLVDARISIESPSGGFRETYIDVTSTESSDSYNVEGETRRSISCFALDKIKEHM